MKNIESPNRRSKSRHGMKYRVIGMKYQVPDKKEAEAFFRANWGKLERYCISRGVNGDDAQDLTFQTLNNAWKAFSRLRGTLPKIKRKSYAWAILRNQLKSFWSKAKRTPEMLPLFEDTDRSLIDEAITDVDVRIDVETAIKTLLNRVDQMIVRNFLMGFSHEEITDKLNQATQGIEEYKVDAVRQHYSRAVKKIREYVNR